MKPSNIFDVQISTPGTRETADGAVSRRPPHYVSQWLHVITTTGERALELVRTVYPGCVVHQVIKRSTATDVIVDPELPS